jgi:hypothetical protein
MLFILIPIIVTADRHLNAISEHNGENPKPHIGRQSEKIENTPFVYHEFHPASSPHMNGGGVISPYMKPAGFFGGDGLPADIPLHSAQDIEYAPTSSIIGTDIGFGSHFQLFHRLLAATFDGNWSICATADLA